MVSRLSLRNAGPEKSPRRKWSNDTWYHVAWTFDGESIRMYVDGVEEAALERGGEHMVQGDGRFNLGSNAGAGAYDGYMDDLTVWDEALSASDILTLTQNGVEVFLEHRDVGCALCQWIDGFAALARDRFDGRRETETRLLVFRGCDD